MPDETPEILGHVDTASLRKLRAQMVAGSDINDKLHAVVGLISQVVDSQLTHPKRVDRDKKAASSAKADAEKARAAPAGTTDALKPIAAPYEPPAPTLFSEAPKGA